MNKKPAFQRGVSLVTAIFLLVILAGLGTGMVTFFSIQQQSSRLDVLGGRAYQSSRAGIEWGSFQLLQNNAGAYAVACRPGSTVQTIPALAGTLSGFTVAVTCNSILADENGSIVRIYQLIAVAQTTGLVAGNPNFVERQMNVTLEMNNL